MIRSLLIENTRDRMTNPEFVKVFGVGMHKVSEARILDLALTALYEQIEAAPKGKTGLPWFDREGL